MTAGLYIHMPFCEKKCGYCDFYSVANRDSQIPSYLSALKKELELYSGNTILQGFAFETLYFGGGTPSVLEGDQIYSIVDSILALFKFISNPEITIETNPGTVNLRKLESYRKAGVNRLSLGVQSFQPDELKMLERIHTVEESLLTFSDARKVGFENISVDLIFALPNQNLDTWKNNLEIAVNLAPEHISAYNLTFEKDTPFSLKYWNEELKDTTEEDQREMQLSTIEFLEINGYDQYEISNYAFPNLQSKHNQKYWDGSFYLGVGASAHSFVDKRRFWNVSNIEKYIELLAIDELPIAGEEHLDVNTQSFEKVLLGLRQMRGINLKAFETDLGFSLFDKYLKPLSRFFSGNFMDKNIIADLTNGTHSMKNKYMEIESGFLKLTKKGILLCDSICQEFV